MNSPQFSRRGFLAAAIAGTASAWLAAHASDLAAAASISAGHDEYLILTAQQAAILDAVTAQLIPTDDTPGAREAKVVRFLDRAFASFMKDDYAQLDPVLQQLAEITAKEVPGAASFTALNDAQQIAVLTSFEKEHKDSFAAVRGVTILGMMSNPSYGGNADKSGWKMIGFVDQFAWAPPFGWYDRV